MPLPGAGGGGGGGGAQIELLGARALPLVWFPVLAGAICIIAAQLWRFGKSSPGPTPLMLLIWSGALTLFGAVFLLRAVRMVVVKTTVLIRGRRGPIAIESSIGPFKRRREIPGGDVTDIVSTRQGQSTTRPFYAIDALLSDGSSRRICGTIFDKGDADWLSAEFEKELGG
jgi:hypothetical protein